MTTGNNLHTTSPQPSITCPRTGNLCEHLKCPILIHVGLLLREIDAAMGRLVVLDPGKGQDDDKSNIESFTPSTLSMLII